MVNLRGGDQKVHFLCKECIVHSEPLICMQWSALLEQCAIAMFRMTSSLASSIPALSSLSQETMNYVHLT